MQNIQSAEISNVYPAFGTSIDGSDLVASFNVPAVGVLAEFIDDLQGAPAPAATEKFDHTPSYATTPSIPKM